MSSTSRFEIIPQVRCTCGKVTGHLQDKFASLIQSGVPIDEVYAQLDLSRYCCKQTIMSPIVYSISASEQDKDLIQGIKGMSINPVRYAPAPNMIRQLAINPLEGEEEILLPTGQAAITSKQLPTVKSSKKEEPFVGSGKISIPVVELQSTGASTEIPGPVQMVDVGSGLKVPRLTNRAFYAV